MKVLQVRKKRHLTQGEFWSRIGISQSGGSRYETGRRIPKPIAILLELAYGEASVSANKYEKLRDERTFAKDC